MDNDTSLHISAEIGSAIAAQIATVSFSDADVRAELSRYTEDEKHELTRMGLYHGDDELFYAVKRFCDKLGLWQIADDEYLAALFSNARKYTKEQFLREPYLAAVQIPEVSCGRFRLVNEHYGKGEFFQYDMPLETNGMVVPRIGFAAENVSFPGIYEDDTPWMSVCPSEINSMREDIAAAHGKVLVLGLGLGYYPFAVSAHRNVSSVTIVERQEEIIRLFRDHILPQFPHREKIRIIKADAFDFLNETENGSFDFCYADIWEGVADGAAAYRKIREHEKRLYETTFAYWIRHEIEKYLGH